jgi:hypothetical protein
MNNTRDITVEEKPGTMGVTVYEWSKYPPSSVLAGQHRKKYLDQFRTWEEALDSYPEGIVTGYNPPAEVPRQAPPGYYSGNGGFYNAGEYWSEDDY